MFSRMCQDPDLVIGLFLNYDCDENSQTMASFQRIIGVLEKINQTKLSNDIINPAEELRLKRTAVETLTSAMASMLAWTKKSLKERKELEILQRKNRIKNAELTQNDKNEIPTDTTDNKNKNTFSKKFEQKRNNN
eukprot:UN33869